MNKKLRAAVATVAVVGILAANTAPAFAATNYFQKYNIAKIFGLTGLVIKK
jgi:hypothetical protein